MDNLGDGVAAPAPRRQRDSFTAVTATQIVSRTIPIVASIVLEHVRGVMESEQKAKAVVDAFVYVLASVINVCHNARVAADVVAAVKQSPRAQKKLAIALLVDLCKKSVSTATQTMVTNTEFYVQKLNDNGCSLTTDEYTRGVAALSRLQKRELHQAINLAMDVCSRIARPAN